MLPLECILLVDDDPSDTERLLATLQQHNLANQVVAVREGVEALEYLHRQGKFAARPGGNPLVILLGLKAPRLDGLQVLRQLKSDRQLYPIPVIVLAQPCQPEDLKAGYRLGANAFIMKPVLFGDLLEAMLEAGVGCALINQPSAQPAASLGRL
jgi:CheY-like chemotaxis protein